MTLLQRPGALDAAVAAVLDALEAQERPPSTLLIDDVHLVDDNPETVASLALFIQHLPRWLQVDPHRQACPGSSPGSAACPGAAL